VPPIAEIIDVGDLINVIWTSIVAGLGVCAVFSAAIFGFARGTDMRREGNAVGMVAFMALALVSFVAVMALVVYGVIVMTAK
jgi:cation transporter-like permease